MKENFTKHLTNTLNTEVRTFRAVGGGSINETGVLETANGNYFLKTNSKQLFPKMFELEARGLELLGSTGAIKVPEVIAHGVFEDQAFLIMEYIPKGPNYGFFWETFGQSLASLHRNSAESFGLDHNNYIGSLHQRNNRHENFVDFFINERIKPQAKMAMDSGYLESPTLKAFENLYKALPSIIPEEAPSLIHGDLWSGNYLADQDEEPVLIDPAVCYGHREMDLAMSTLFGGFDESFYDSYDEVFPTAPGLENRISIYNLYYLLVHVNLFGRGYVSSVERIVKNY